jgi:type IV pilus assembly protein PilV
VSVLQIRSGSATGARGFTLLEVLVAVLVLSIGLLGLAGLQTYGLRNNHSAFLRSQAVVMAYDAFDRMRGNREQALLGTGSNYNTAFTDAAPSAPSCTSCSSTQVAQIDLAEWKTDVARLPAGRGRIAIDANGKATIQVQWADNRDSDAAQLLTVTVESLI